MTRPTKHQTFMEVAQSLKKQGTCVRRQVGAVIVNKRHHIISTGYNGVASGLSHCIYHPCQGAAFSSGEGLELCEAIHAEQNALLQCRDVYDIDRIYVTTPPCLHCIKLLLNTSCETIYVCGEYPHSERSKQLWLSANRKWVQL